MYVVMSRHQNVRRTHNLLIGKKSFKNIEKFKYLRTTLADQNWVHEELKADEIREMLTTIFF
jgi:hypothetical protein